ncbi:MAG: hypothetical protein ABH873_07515 [Candidatus Firestonebacteria bacterium]
MFEYCGWCNKHINLLNFQKVALRINGNIEKKRLWFCAPRCLLEFNRLYEGSNFNMRLDVPKALKAGKW